ncbi:MAG: hypothetical protein IKJ01_07920 [Lachnospiraceae bacterium]|nr:hypothetical protein [Lachnospiraceae bacterium]
MKNIKKIFLLLNLLFVLSLIACSSMEHETEDSINNIEEEQEDVLDSKDTYDSSHSNLNSNSKTSIVEHYCEVTDCYNEGIYTIEGFSDLKEYYCYTHYKEMQDTISYMEETVGSGNASKHTCESCSREGTHSIEGFSGRTEYYCTQHYNEMVEILEMLLGEE